LNGIPAEPGGSPLLTAEVIRDSRQELAGAWAEAVWTTAYLPVSGAEFERAVCGWLHAMLDELAGCWGSGAAATSAGAALVAAHATGQQSLRRSVEVLAVRLPLLPELAGRPDLPAVVAAVLGRLAAGYADALRHRTFEQQEDVKQALERVLRLSEARFREVFVASAVGIAISDLDGTVVQANRALAEILGCEDQELVNRDVLELVAGAAAESLRPAYRDVATGRTARLHLRWLLRRQDGEEAWVMLAVSALRDERGARTHHLTMVEDITDPQLLQERMNDQALHDQLTGLPNRQSFGLRLESRLAQLDPAAVITLLQLDLDSFSVINDGLGYEVGDRLLALVAQRLRLVFARERVLVARVASDEFAVLIEDAPGTPDVATLAAMVNDELAEPVYLDKVGLAVSASIGIVRRPAGGIAHTELLRQADATLHRAKRNGKRQWALFDAPQDTRDRQRFELMAAMPGALENGEFRLLFRPLARLADRRLASVEALLSWAHPDGGQLRHDEVLALAEHTGVVLPIGSWLLRAACAEAAQWCRRFGTAAPRLSIDLALAQASDPDLVATVNGVLNDVGLPAERLRLGLPLGALLHEHGDAEDNLRVLADTGVHTAVHGFGAGAGGLAFLEDLPVRAVRVAAWLARRVVERPASATGRALVQLISLVRQLEVGVTVTGVRTEQAASWWQRVGCDLAGGDFFAAPLPAAAVADLLAAH
jgi:diguanylate cyclase (GGDEF)-like protein/PAS domain S-box-containing protein